MLGIGGPIWKITRTNPFARWLIVMYAIFEGINSCGFTTKSVQHDIGALLTTRCRSQNSWILKRGRRQVNAETKAFLPYCLSSPQVIGHQPLATGLVLKTPDTRHCWTTDWNDLRMKALARDAERAPFQAYANTKKPDCPCQIPLFLGFCPVWQWWPEKKRLSEIWPRFTGFRDPNSEQCGKSKRNKGNSVIQSKIEFKFLARFILEKGSPFPKQGDIWNKSQRSLVTRGNPQAR